MSDEGTGNSIVTEGGPKTDVISNATVIARALEGGRIASGLARTALNDAIAKHGADKAIEYPETAYELPIIYAWDGAEVHTLGDIVPVLENAVSKMTGDISLPNALAAGEALMVSAEIIEALKYLDGARPYEGTDHCGFIPDRVLRGLGVALVDDTIPGIAVLIGHTDDPAGLAKLIRDMQGKGMLIF
ncbi:MAG: CO dehydrogenase/CO-methylating acetyl-CoA synthase complex subunit beta, partial [Euryarchaeota archaeon]|nr:CO dehydrogenase/CO-methylating acetyl-CoA synthase complex subunit beta [Euryarchaeota archaeon]